VPAPATPSARACALPELFRGFEAVRKLHCFEPMRILVGALMSAVWLFRADIGQACSVAAPTYSYEWGAPVEPGAPLNTPVFIGVSTSQPTDYRAESPRVHLVQAETGREVELLEVRSPGSPLAERGIMSFVPVAPLAPETTYRVGVTSVLIGAADGVESPEVASWQFTTGTTSAPTLRATGQFSAVFSEAVAPHRDCPSYQGCGEVCVENGSDRVTKAIITLPRVLGGFREYGLPTQVIVTNDVPFSFASPPEVIVSAQADAGASEQPTSVEVIVPPLQSGQAFRPCVVARVTDARGDTLDIEGQCFDAISPLQVPLTREAEPLADDGADTDDRSTEPATRTRSSSACSFGAPASAGSWLGGIALATVALRRVRRARNSANKSYLA
jgi:hypothetical protein